MQPEDCWKHYFVELEAHAQRVQEYLAKGCLEVQEWTKVEPIWPAIQYYLSSSDTLFWLRCDDVSILCGSKVFGFTLNKVAQSLCEGS